MSRRPASAWCAQCACRGLACELPPASEPRRMCAAAGAALLLRLHLQRQGPLDRQERRGCPAPCAAARSPPSRVPGRPHSEHSHHSQGLTASQRMPSGPAQPGPQVTVRPGAPAPGGRPRRPRRAQPRARPTARARIGLTTATPPRRSFRRGRASTTRPRTRTGACAWRARRRARRPRSRCTRACASGTTRTATSRLCSTCPSPCVSPPAVPPRGCLAGQQGRAGCPQVPWKGSA